MLQARFFFCIRQPRILHTGLQIYLIGKIARLYIELSVPGRSGSIKRCIGGTRVNASRVSIHEIARSHRFFFSSRPTVTHGVSHKQIPKTEDRDFRTFGNISKDEAAATKPQIAQGPRHLISSSRDACVCSETIYSKPSLRPPPPPIFVRHQTVSLCWQQEILLRSFNVAIFQEV